MDEAFYTTRELMSHNRADQWRRFISNTFVELDCDGMSGQDFFGELHARSVGNLGISAITTDGYDVFRTKSAIAGSNVDDFLVSVQTKGSSVIRQLGREAVLNPGDFTIYDSTAPYHLHFTRRLSQIVVQVPRELLKRHFQTPEALTAVRFQGGGGMAEIATRFARSAFHQSPMLDEHSQEQVANTLLELLATSLRVPDAAPPRESMSRETQLVRIKYFIGERLKDPSLSPALTAASNGITVRYLQRLFEADGISPARYIRDQRLERARADLADKRLAHQTISQICYKWAFTDTAHFSRAFKAAHGHSPREYRRRALSLSS